jgi:predicted phage terminase large subunit-like protein
MPLKNHQAPNQNKLSEQERQMLALALQQAKARNLTLPTDIPNLRRELEWNVDEHGYFIKFDGTQFKPNNQAQVDFIDSKAAFSLYRGSRGCGKTSAGAQKALRKIKQGESGTVINPDFENFKLSTWSELREWIPWELVVPSQRYRQNPAWEAQKPFTIVFMNGARMYCKGLKDPDSARGANVNWLWYDEGRRDRTGTGWLLAIASVRVGKDTQRWCTTTPASRDHWLYKFFIEKNIPEEALEAYRESQPDESIPLVQEFHAHLEDNKENLDPMFYASLLASYTTGWMKTQEIDGDFADEGGALGNKAWFLNKHLLAEPEAPKRKVRYWDLAASERKIAKRKSDDPDSTIGTKMIAEGGRFVICDQRGGQLLWHDIKKLIVATAYLDGVDTEVWIEQEPASGGINQVAEIAGMPELAGYFVKGHNPREFGDKVMRAMPWFARAAQGLIYYVVGDWVNSFLDQVANFPIAMHDDKVDGVSGAFAVLSGKRNWKDIPFMKL